MEDELHFGYDGLDEPTKIVMNNFFYGKNNKILALPNIDNTLIVNEKYEVYELIKLSDSVKIFACHSNKFIKNLNIENSLVTFVTINNLSNLKSLKLSSTTNKCYLFDYINIEEFTIPMDSDLRILGIYGNLPNLKSIDLKNCKNLEYITCNVSIKLLNLPENNVLKINYVI